jgi:hypothetical protein
MPLRFVLDENLRGPLWNAIQRHNLRGIDVLDVVRVGDAGAPPLESTDPEILLWSETAGRILVTLDRATVPEHLRAHVAAGHDSPGVFMVPRRGSIPSVIEYLVLAAYAGDPDEFRRRVTFIA